MMREHVRETVKRSLEEEKSKPERIFPVGMREPVRNTVERSIAEERMKPAGFMDPIGLVENVTGVHFQCATCKYFEEGICINNDPRLYGAEVEGRWCCNKYEHPGMKIVLA